MGRGSLTQLQVAENLNVIMYIGFVFDNTLRPGQLHNFDIILHDTDFKIECNYILMTVIIKCIHMYILTYKDDRRTEKIKIFLTKADMIISNYKKTLWSPCFLQEIFSVISVNLNKTNEIK